MTTTDAAGFLAAIREHPGDDTPRLVYADWLDEHGEPERAEFIRVQVELAKCPPEVLADPRWDDLRYAVAEPWDTLRRRNTDLFIALSNGQRLSLPAGCEPAMCESPAALTGDDEDAVVVFRRGFGEVVICPDLAALLGTPCERCDGTRQERVVAGYDGNHGVITTTRTCSVCSGVGRVGGCRAVLRTEPVTTVWVTDREPRAVSDSLGRGWTWSRESSSAPRQSAVLPDEIRGLLPRDRCQNRALPRFVRWDTPEFALDALSAAVIAWARGPG